MLPDIPFEMLLVGVVALIVVGPKDLPILLRKIGQFVAKMRGLAAEFRASFEELARQSELDELRKEVEALKNARIEPHITQDIGAELSEIHRDIHANLTGDGSPNPALADPNQNVMLPLQPAAAEPAPKVRRSRSTKKPAFEPLPELTAKPKRAPKSEASKTGAEVAAKPARKRAAKAAAEPAPEAAPPLAERTG